MQGEEIIVVIPWIEWWEEALKDSSNPQIALLPLHPDLRAKFNSTAAWAYAKSMTGKPYGYHNMIFSWIDTLGDNYPPPLDSHLVCIATKQWMVFLHLNGKYLCCQFCVISLFSGFVEERMTWHFVHCSSEKLISQPYFFQPQSEC